MHVQTTWPTGPSHRGIQGVTAAEIVDDPDNEIWNVQLSSGEVRTVTLDKLNDLYRFSIIDDSAFVWQAGMANWTRLATLLGVDQPEPEEQFHVQLSPGNVKQVTLEQLDDYFRYGAIDEHTLVWKTGLSEWQTLGKLAGLDAPTQTNATRTAAVAAPQQQPAMRTAAVAAPQQQPAMRTTTARPQPPSARTAAPAPAVAASQYQHARTAVPPAAASQLQTVSRSGATTNFQPALAPSAVPVVRSAPPISFSIEPGVEKPSAAANWLLRLAIAAGVILALVRNDLVYSVASKTTLAARYAEAERSLAGGPLFGTERAVAQWVEENHGHLEAVRLPVAVDTYASAQKRAATLPAKADEPLAKTATSAAIANTASAKAAGPTSEEKKSAQPNSEVAAKTAATEKPAAPAAATPVKSLSAMPPSARGKSSSTRSTTAAARPTKKASGSSKAALRSNGNYFDPLNPSL